jgi:hypothetical protein
MEEKTQEEELEALKNECANRLPRLKRNEDFKFWKEQVVEPLMAQLEAELASKDADLMPEAILRGKLKHLNSLKFIFKEVFNN